MDQAGWQPQIVRRFIKGFPSSARTALVETDAGMGYLKAMGGPEGPHTLASELVATQLADWFGLATFDWAIVMIDDVDEIPFVDAQGRTVGIAAPGPAFITRAESGITWSGEKEILGQLENPQDLARLVIFDTWVLNCDRHSPEGTASHPGRRPNRDNVFLSAEASAGLFLLKAMDHTHCFTCGREWTGRLNRLDVVRDSRVFGLFPEFRTFLTPSRVEQTITDLTSLPLEKVRSIVESIPGEWEVPKIAGEALIELITRRAAFVAQTIGPHLLQGLDESKADHQVEGSTE